MSDLPERNDAARFAKSIFYEDFNDIDVYIEDTGNGYEKIFSIILQRLLRNSFTITKVFALGGRDKVIEASELPKDPNRKSIFIVDGDLYLLCGERKKLPDDVISLSRYCIENYLVDEEVLVDMMDDEDSTRHHEEIKRLFNFEEWRMQSTDLFQRLFVMYSVAHILESGERTVSRKMSEFLKNDMGEMEEGKIEAVCLLIRTNLNAKYGEERVEREAVRIAESFVRDECFVLKYVSAKSYTLPMLFLRMRSIVKLSTNNLTLKIRLAKKCDLQSMEQLKHKILKIAA